MPTKWADHLKIHKKMTEKDKFYGTTTVGTKGQVVIPVQARLDLKIRPGDQLMVMGKFGKALGLMKVNELEGFVKTLMGNLAGTGLEALAKKGLEKMLVRVNVKKKH